MNESRLKLHEELVGILGSRNVYFQPPENIKIQYPAIIYSRSDIKNRAADNRVYSQDFEYKVTVIDKSPDSVIVEKLSKFEFSSFDRHYTANGLNHSQFTISFNKKQ